MYTIYVYDGEHWQHVLSNDDRYTVESATLSESVNAAPVLTFKVYEGHPSLSYLLAAIESPLPATAQPTIMARRDGSTCFEGRIYQHTLDDFTGAHEFTCEGMLARLSDYTVRPYSYAGTVSGYLQYLLVNCEGALNVGNVTVTDPNDYIVRSSEKPVMLWDEIADKCIGSPLGGFLEMRNGYIVDWLVQPSATTTQDMEAGINLTGLNITVQPREMYSGVLAYGAEVGVTNSKGVPLYCNLAWANAYDVPVPSGYTLTSMTLFKDSLVSQIGQRVCIVQYESITQVSNLMDRAVAFLNAQSTTPIIQVGAVDLADAGYNADAIECGSTVQITGATFDASMMCTAISRNLLDPSNTTFEFGSSESISGSGGSGGSGGGGSTTSPHFWHTDVEATSTKAGHTLTGFSPEPLDAILTQVENGYRAIDGGSAWIIRTPPHGNVSYDSSAFHLRANGLTARIVSPSLTTCENTLTLTGVTATLKGANTDTGASASVATDGYNGNVSITATNAVNVSADTNITGNLSATGNISADKTIYANDAHVYIRRASLDTTAANNGISTDSYLYHGWRDKNSRFSGWCGNVAYTDGRIATQLAARRVNGTANLDNSLVLAVNPNGNRTVTVSDAAPWLDALRINTWENVAITNFATAASGWSFVTNECQIQYNEALGALRCRIRLTTSAAQTAGQKTVFTVAAAYRPKTLPASLSSLVSNAQAVQLYTTGGAAVNVSALSANANLYFNGVYFIGA